MFVFRPALCFFPDGNATAHPRQGSLGHCRRLASRAHRRGPMCGIAGFLGGGAGRDLGRVARAMADALRHRGPDDAGTRADAEADVALGHRRLAVIDLSPAGRQPMPSASGRYVLVLNGEIYNFRRLRAALEPRGHRFRGHSDTEVLLAAVEAWGVEEALRRAEGMFALALWDRGARTLTLARDRVGKKPLYHGRFGGTLLFGSELRALRAHPDFVGEIDRDALGQYVRDGWVSGERTIHRGVRRLPPGCLLQLRAGDGEARPRPYWSARDAAESAAGRPFAGTYEEAVDRLDALLRQAVEDRLAAYVPLGALLSGGIDSSTVVGVMRAVSGAPVRTFSIGFHEPAVDEAGFAREVAGHLGTAPRGLYASPPDALDTVHELPAVYDEPLGDSSAVPTVILSRLARRHVTVALSGDGGGELFLGYPSYFNALERWQAGRGLPAPVRELGRHLGGAAGRLAWSLPSLRGGRPEGRPRGWRGAARKLERRTSRWGAALPEEMIAEAMARCRGAEGLVLGAARVPLADPARRARLAEPLRAMAFQTFGDFLTDDVLAKGDRASMAVGLEVRSPILDVRVVEFAWSLPTAFLVDGQGGGKRVLKDVLARYVPRGLTDRPKRGFGMPVDAWLRGPVRGWGRRVAAWRGGPSGGGGGDWVAGPLLRRQGLRDARRVRRVWDQHQAG